LIEYVIISRVHDLIPKKGKNPTIEGVGDLKDRVVAVSGVELSNGPARSSPTGERV
jgi:hypothetical protein